MNNILLFASGGGSNVKAILNHFRDRSDVHFPIIVTNKANAGVITIAKEFGIDTLLINKEIFNDEIFIDTIDFYKPTLIVLAGFLWKIPNYMTKAYSNKIINIHPALLPKYGGKGMYGHHVHEAVVSNKETKSGITIHFVNQHYDEGTILLQKEVKIEVNDSSVEVANKVLKLEHEWYSKVIESLLIVS